MNSRVRVIVTGLIATFPLPGMTWHYLQYLLGLLKLGHDVYYIEDSGAWPYDPTTGGKGLGCEFNVQYLARLMTRFGLGERWAYRFAEGAHRSTWYGLPDARRREVVESADLLLNVSGTVAVPADYRAVKRLVYIDTDPVFAQLKLLRGDAAFAEQVGGHDIHFSFGERLTDSLPSTGHQWLATRQPIVLDQWKSNLEPGRAYRTVMNWTSYASETFEGRSYGQKDMEFRRFISLPERLPSLQFELACAQGHTNQTPRDLLKRSGWSLVDPAEVCPDIDAYRRYIQLSRAEWSIAKNGYVQAQSGWFSERSACYLAAGRPVVMQDTGFSRVLPTGTGLVSFSTPDEACAAIESVEAKYHEHAEAARGIADEYFNSSRVLRRLLEQSQASASAHCGTSQP